MAAAFTLRFWMGKLGLIKLFKKNFCLYALAALYFYPFLHVLSARCP